MKALILLTIMLFVNQAEARDIIPHTGPYMQVASNCVSGGSGSKYCLDELKLAGKGILGDAIFIIINGLIYSHNGEMEDDIKEQLKN